MTREINLCALASVSFSYSSLKCLVKETSSNSWTPNVCKVRFCPKKILVGTYFEIQYLLIFDEIENRINWIILKWTIAIYYS